MLSVFEGMLLRINEVLLYNINGFLATQHYLYIFSLWIILE